MAVLFVESFIQIATIRLGLCIICFKGSQVDLSNKSVLQSLNIPFIITKGADPDEMQQTTKPAFQEFPEYKRVYCPLSDEFNQVMPMAPKT